MPTVDVTIAPSATTTRVTVWICRLCGADAELIDNTGSALASIEHFVDRLGWRLIASQDVVCDRCKVLPDVAHLLLADAKAHIR